jgi:predicted 3-demethylubiquinone-9 3-methyltransferase (glyoxalase superfamily)
LQTMTTCLWFDTQAEEAALYYTGVFPDGEMRAVSRYGEAGPGPAGTVMTVAFRLLGHEFMGLNGGPLFTFSPAVSFVVNCESQEDVDYYWERLSEGGETGQCGWLTDKFGVSWQVVPTALARLVSQSDPQTAKRVTEAMLKMNKLVIADLEKAAAGC